MENVSVFTHKVDIIGSLSGLVTVPKGYDPKKENLPVIVFLHGAGERGAEGDNFRKLIMTHGIPKYFGNNPDYENLRAITFSPACPEDYIWDSLVYPLKAWIDAALEEYGGDKSRIAITGISMGGFGTWNMLCTFPDFFCCGAPICGGGVSWRTRCLSGKKIRVFHGIDDGSVPFEYSFIMTREARNNGADVTLTTFDGCGHNSWEPAYETTDLIKWLVNSGNN